MIPAHASVQKDFIALGLAAAELLQYQALEPNRLLQLQLIFKNLGGILLPISLKDRQRQKLPWLNIRGPQDFIMADDWTDTRHSVSLLHSAQALYYYILVSQGGKTPFKTNNDLGPHYHTAKYFAAGFLIPKIAIPYAWTGEASLKQNIAANCGAIESLIQLRCENSGLI